MRKTFRFFLSLLAFTFLQAAAMACPFCSEGLARNSGGFSGGLTMGIVITIFFFLGMIGSLAGFVIYLMIKEGKKSDRRHQLAAQAAAAAASAAETV